MTHIQKTAPGPADGDRRGDTRQIPRADAAGQRHGECLERRDMLLAPGAASGRLAQHAHHLTQHTKLHAARTQREPDGAPQQECDQQV